MSPQPPKTIYTALTNAGASTTQAIGIMANIINESGFDPEAVGDNGTSFGIVQEHGSQYSGLVTGNDQKDLRAQVTLLAQQGAFSKASGATGADAAGNFAANYEECVGCQPGGDQYNGRTGNAATVAGWVSSGNWPKSAGSATAAATGGAQSAPGCPPTCVTCNFPHTSWCPLTKTMARALIGGVLLAGSGFVFLVGSLVLASYGLRGTAAGKAAGRSAEAALGAVPVAGGPLRAAAGGVRKAAGARRTARATRPAREAAAGSRAATARSEASTRELRGARGGATPTGIAAARTETAARRNPRREPA